MTNTERIINVFIDLLHGDELTPEALATKYQVTTRTAQRDLGSLRDLLQKSELKYVYQHDMKTKTYALRAMNQLTPATVLAILKQLIGTRAFGKSELDQISNELLDLIEPTAASQVRKLCATTRAQYVPVSAGEKALLPRLQQFSEWIASQTTLTFTYEHSDRRHVQSEVGLPISLYFSDFYFYVIMYSNQDPRRVYRLDRFKAIQPTQDVKLKLKLAEKTDEGDFMNKTYLLHGGNETTYRFRYWGLPQTALDRLPHSHVVPETKKVAAANGGGVVIEANGFEQGTLLWVLSQGTTIKVLAPASLVAKVKQELTRTLAQYQE